MPKLKAALAATIVTALAVAFVYAIVSAILGDRTSQTALLGAMVGGCWYWAYSILKEA